MLSPSYTYTHNPLARFPDEIREEDYLYNAVEEFPDGRIKLLFEC